MDDENIIHSYKRKQAIEDGVLYDVTELAKKVGFKVPVCITIGVHKLCEEHHEEHDYDCRVLDVLSLAIYKFKEALQESENKARLVSLKPSIEMFSKKKAVTTLWLVFNESEGFTLMKPDEY